MTDLILALRLVHILGASVLFGTGLGIAFFMWMANRANDPANIAATAGIVVIADTVFTAVAVVVQPISGAWLAWLIGYSLLESWILAALTLYVIVGLCWLPVVIIQIRLRDLARAAAQQSANLPNEYRRLYAIWFALGWPAFIGVILIFGLMIWRPSLW
ncbi:MAG: DUF2269 domain-containing protein [Xanthobacteraceae bacterium]|nr:DUF2269 domain-containing protein [Xanthobacteraceae bacterium]